MQCSTNDPLKFSVCIPTYNRGTELLYTIKSVVDQSYPFWELIIVDDSTNNDTLEIVKLIDDKRIIYYRNSKRLGLVKNWNKCLKLASNDFRMILHHDDFLLRDALLNYKLFIDNYPEARFIHANSYNARLPFSLKVDLVPKKKKVVLEEGDEGILDIIYNYGITCSTVVFHKQCIESVGYYDEDCWVSPDWEYSARIARYFKTYFLEKPTAVYVYHSKNTHTTDYEVDKFADQSRYHYQKVIKYLSNPESLESVSDDGLQEAIKGLAVMMFIDGKYSKSFKFFRYAKKRVKISTIIYSILKRAEQIFKSMFFKRFTYKQLFESNFNIINQ